MLFCLLPLRDKNWKSKMKKWARDALFCMRCCGFRLSVIEREFNKSKKYFDWCKKWAFAFSSSFSFDVVFYRWENADKGEKFKNFDWWTKRKKKICEINNHKFDSRLMSELSSTFASVVAIFMNARNQSSRFFHFSFKFVYGISEKTLVWQK